LLFPILIVFQPPNPVTVEKLRMIMEQEGRSARNLVSWSIPVESHTASKRMQL